MATVRDVTIHPVCHFHFYGCQSEHKFVVQLLDVSNWNNNAYNVGPILYTHHWAMVTEKST